MIEKELRLAKQRKDWDTVKKLIEIQQAEIELKQSQLDLAQAQKTLEQATAEQNQKPLNHKKSALKNADFRQPETFKQPKHSHNQHLKEMDESIARIRKLRQQNEWITKHFFKIWLASIAFWSLIFWLISK